MPGGKPTGRDGHRHPRQQHRHQGRQAQEALSAIQGGTQLGAGVAYPLELLSRAQPRLQPGTKAAQPARLAGHQQVVIHPAGGLQQLGGLQVVLAHEQARGHVEQLPAPVRLVDEHPPHVQGGRPHLQGIAGLQTQGIEQPGLQPDRPWCGAVADGAPRTIGTIGHLQRAA